jgi:FAD/FMN-containing dehydrogenase
MTIGRRRNALETNRHAGVRHIAFDLSLPAAAMESYTGEIANELSNLIGEHKLFIFGHLGDGNLHIVVDVEPNRYSQAKPKVEELVYRMLSALGGSVSAEHGIGVDKKRWLSVSRSEAEISLMRSIKSALDPKGILNPGKLI